MIRFAAICETCNIATPNMLVPTANLCSYGDPVITRYPTPEGHREINCLTWQCGHCGEWTNTVLNEYEMRTLWRTRPRVDDLTLVNLELPDPHDPQCDRYPLTDTQCRDEIDALRMYDSRPGLGETETLLDTIIRINSEKWKRTHPAGGGA